MKSNGAVCCSPVLLVDDRLARAGPETKVSMQPFCPHQQSRAGLLAVFGPRAGGRVPIRQRYCVGPLMSFLSTTRAPPPASRADDHPERHFYNLLAAPSTASDRAKQLASLARRTWQPRAVLRVFLKGFAVQPGGVAVLHKSGARRYRSRHTNTNGSRFEPLHY